MDMHYLSLGMVLVTNYTKYQSLLIIKRREKMKTVKRRDFIKKSTVVSAGIAVGAPAYIKGFVQNKPSEMVNVAVIGLNSRGVTHMNNFNLMPNSRVVALCDCVEYLLPELSKRLVDSGGDTPKTFIDYRDMLDDKDIDVISIAAPGYWHALMTINACQAGKDVYCEKPLSYNIDEGRKMVQAARKYNRIVQTGTQHRSNSITQKGVQLLHEGVIGDVYMGRGTVYRRRSNIGTKPDSPVPKGVNWDLFRGPAPMIPFNENHFMYNWHWYWDTTTTEFGNNGVHAMDRIRWGMNINEHPTKIACCGGFYAYDDSDQEVPNLEVATFEYANGAVMELEVRSLPNPGGEGGLLFLGTKGYALINGSSFEAFVDGEPGPARAPAAGAQAVRAPRSAPTPTVSITREDLPVDARQEELAKLGRIDPHFVNFLDAVKSRRYQDLIADVEQGHISTAQMHLGNIAYRTGRKLIFDGKTEKFVNDNDANTYLARPGGGRKPFNIPNVV